MKVGGRGFEAATTRMLRPLTASLHAHSPSPQGLAYLPRTLAEMRTVTMSVLPRRGLPGAEGVVKGVQQGGRGRGVKWYIGGWARWVGRGGRG